MTLKTVNTMTENIFRAAVLGRGLLLLLALDDGPQLRGLRPSQRPAVHEGRALEQRQVRFDQRR